MSASADCASLVARGHNLVEKGTFKRGMHFAQ
jgi:hypothetical protein